MKKEKNASKIREVCLEMIHPFNIIKKCEILIL